MPNLLLSGRAQQLHGPLPFCCCQRRAEPEFFIRKGRQSPKAAIPIGQRAERGEGPAIRPPRSKKRVLFALQITRTVGHPRPSSFSMKNKSISESVFLPPPSLRRAFPLVVGGSIPLSERRRAFFRYGVGLNIGSNMIGRVLATPCVQYQKSLWGAVGMTKRGRVLH